MAFLREFGRYVPARVVGNPELAQLLGCDADWIFNAAGIRERRWADSSESVVDLADRAARDCLARAGADAGEIGLLLVSSGSSERRFPGPAAETGARLGIPGVPAIDVPLASAGSLFAMALGAQLSGSYGRVLVVAAEKMSAIIQDAPLNRNTAILFGDAAGACLIDPHEGSARVVDSRLHSDGACAADLRLEFNQPLHMKGPVVIRHASQKLPAVIREVLDRCGQPAASIEAFLMHQANQNLIVRVAQALETAPEKFFSNIARYGNTSSASMLVAASEWNESAGFRTGSPVVFAGFGAGFHWGALLAIGS